MENFDTVYTIWDHPIVKSLFSRYWQKFLIKKLPMKKKSRTHWTVLRTVSMNFFFFFAYLRLLLSLVRTYSLSLLSSLWLSLAW